MTKLNEVRSWFPQDLEDLLLFEEKENYVIIRPRQYLHGDKFPKIATIVREHGGEYISAGKNSHFRAKTSGEEKPKPQSSEEKPKPSEAFFYCPHCNGKIKQTIGKWFD